MLKTIRGLILGLVVLVDSAYVTPTYASSASIVIIRVQAGSLASPLHEAVTIYNNSDERVDLSQWCFVNKAKVRFACFGQVGIRGDRFLLPHTTTSVISAQLAQSTPYEQYSAAYDVTNGGSGSIIASSDIISLVDSNDTVVDQHLWTTPLQNGSMWRRQWNSSSASYYIDTNSLHDWRVVPQEHLPISEAYFLGYSSDIDTCTNIDGYQSGVPRGFNYEEPFLCHQKPPLTVLPVMDGYENVTAPPVDDEPDEGGAPDGSEGNSDHEPEPGVETLPLHPVLSEILANVTGSDAGKEYIELFNPHDIAISLEGYEIRYGKELEYTLTLPALVLEPQEYLALTNSEQDFSLLNTENKVALFLGEETVDETMYSNPKEDAAWALIAGSWTYTDIATPDEANVPSSTMIAAAGPAATTKALKSTTTALLAPCGPGKERNPVTNRCRTIAAASDSEPTPCKEGQERNPETNRCRTVREIKKADYGVIGARTETQSGSLWYAWASIAGVVLLALSYAAWEWRVEVGRFVKRVVNVFVRRVK